MQQGLSVRGFIEGHCIPDIFIPQLVELYMQGKFPFDKLISFYPFERINDAITDQLAGKIIKPVLRCDITAARTSTQRLIIWSTVVSDPCLFRQWFGSCVTIDHSVIPWPETIAGSANRLSASVVASL